MSKIIKIILILTVAAGIGLALGFKNREVEVQVFAPNGQTAETSFVLRSSQLDQSSLSQQLENLPWFISRASAITAYLLMFVVIFWGAGMTMGFIYVIANPVEAWVIHKYLSLAMGATLLIHILSLLYDKFINFKIFDILIPFYSAYKPLYLSLGIIGFYLLLIIIFTSLLIRLKLPRFWRATHYLVYVLFIFSIVHGIFLGTDTKTLAMRSVYWITGVMFFLLLSYRFYWSYKNRA